MGTKNKKYLEKFLRIIKEKGGIPLFESNKWDGCRTRYAVRCQNGHEWKCLPVSTFSRGDWCKSCAGYLKKTKKDYEEIAKKFNGSWIGDKIPKNNKTKTRWKCAKGHEFDNYYNNIQQYNCFCPSCNAPYLGQTLTRQYFEKLTGLNFLTCKPAFLKYKNGFPLELDGFCKELMIAFEYNGLEHYKRSSRQSKKDFEELQNRDLWKYRTTKEKGIKLLVIDEIDGKFDESHIRKQVIDFLIKENIPLKISPIDIFIDLKEIYSDYKLDKLQQNCRNLNITLISDIYINSITKIKIRCNLCQKERTTNAGNIGFMVNKSRNSYCRCTKIIK